nr:MAG TPA: 5'-3' exonuclease [Caudoviricetes sp.]
MAIQKDIVINRKQYQNIKKMDHNQMNLYIQSIYKSGFEDGKAAVPGIDIKYIADIVRGVKGVGEKRAADIVKALESEMARPQSEVGNREGK